MFCIFEHNPISPVTRHIVATCPFDENAVLIPWASSRPSKLAGIGKVGIAYTGFFPGALQALRPLEPAMTCRPARRAQYYAWAHG